MNEVGREARDGLGPELLVELGVHVLPVGALRLAGELGRHDAQVLLRRGRVPDGREERDAAVPDRWPRGDVPEEILLLLHLVEPTDKAERGQKTTLRFREVFG